MYRKYLLRSALGVAFWAMSLTVLLAQSGEIVGVFSIEWSQDASRFALVTREGLTIYDSSFAIVAHQAFPQNSAFMIPYIALSPDGKRIYVGRRTVDPRTIDPTPIQQHCAANWSAVVCEVHAILDTDTLEMVLNLSDISLTPYYVQWSADGLSIAFRSGDDYSTVVYSALDGKLLKAFTNPPLIWAVGYDSGGVEWSPDGRYFARPGGDEVYILDAETGQIVSKHRIGIEKIDNLTWGPDSIHMAITTTADVVPGTPGSVSDPGSVHGARRNSIIIFDVIHPRLVSRIYHPGVSLVTPIAWSPDGSRIAAGIWHGEIFIWNSMTGDLLDSFQAPPHRVHTLGYSPYGGRLIIAAPKGFSDLTPEIDPDFVPLSSYAQLELGGILQFVAPAPSAEKLSAILASCAANAEIITEGTAFLAAQQYREFADWVDQQPDSAVPESCAADLHLIAVTIVDKLSSPPVITTPRPTRTATVVPSSTPTRTAAPPTTPTPLPTLSP